MRILIYFAFCFCFLIIFICVQILKLYFSLCSKFVQFMNAFDRAMNMLDDKFSFLASTKQIVSSTNEEDKVKILLCNIGLVTL